MRYILAIPILLLVLFSQTLMAMDAQPLPEVSSFPKEYQYQREKILYLFLTGDYLPLSKLSSKLIDTSLKEQDETSLLLKLSDIKLLYTGRDYPPFDFQPLSVDLSELLRLLDFVYMMGGYKGPLTLGKELSDKGAAHYFEGTRLSRLNRLEDSGRALAQVPEDDRFYPYARILSAQIEVMKHNLLKAEGYLRGLLSYLSAKEDGPAERVHILLGQILFERGLFTGALKEFLMVSYKSPFYREAVIGQAWSLVKLGQCENAIPVIEKIDPILPYDTIEQEAGKLLGHCYLELKRFEQAVEHFQTLLKTFFAAEERLEQMIGDRSIRERYLSILQGKQSVTLTEEEKHYLSLLRSDPLLSAFLEEHRLFHVLRAGFIRKEKKIIDDEIYIENTTTGLEEMLKKSDKEIKMLKELLLLTSKRVKQTEDVWDMEMIGKDMTSVEDGGEIEFERMFSLISKKGSQRIKEMRETLGKLEKMKEVSERNIMESEKGLKESLYRLDAHIMSRFRKLKYELGDFKRDIIKGLNAAVSGMEELKVED